MKWRRENLLLGSDLRLSSSGSFWNSRKIILGFVAYWFGFVCMGVGFFNVLIVRLVNMLRFDAQEGDTPEVARTVEGARYVGHEAHAWA